MTAVIGPALIRPGAETVHRLRRMLDAVPGLLGGAGTVAVIGDPDEEDAEEALRHEGLHALLGALGLRRVRPGAAAQAAIWLGPGVEALRRMGARAPQPLLLWPSPDLPAEALGGMEPDPAWVLASMQAAAAEGPDLRRIALPDPLHALWGLLDRTAPGGAGQEPLRLGAARDWPAAERPAEGMAKALLRRAAMRVPAGRRRLLAAAAIRRAAAIRPSKRPESWPRCSGGR